MSILGDAYKIRFGTSGWRDRMDSNFNDRNVLRAASGIGAYLKRHNDGGQVVVGYDTRHNSDHFAQLVCGILNDFGFDSIISDAPAPTPAIVMAVASHKAIAGVQVTASHNPPEYNGIKFLLSSGASPLPDVTAEVERLIPDVAKPKPYSRKTFSPKEDYLLALKKRFRLNAVKGMHVVVDTRHGAGGGYLSAVLSANGAHVWELNREYDPDFCGMSPNPTEVNVQGLKDAVAANKADLGIANDGDADRFAVVDASGRYYTANESGLVLCDYLFNQRHEHGTLAKSVQSTAAFDRLCAHAGVKEVEVPVGFKYIAAELMKGAAFGVEGAALGIAFGNWIPDKDGIAAGAAMCEAVGDQKVTLSQIWQRVSQAYSYGQFVTMEFPRLGKVMETLDFLKSETERDMFGGRKIVGRSYLDGVKLNLSDGAWFLARVSGTEPSVRVYIEAATKKEADELSDAARRMFGF